MKKLSKRDMAWFERLQRVLDAAPTGLDAKISSFTIGDKDITVFDPVKVKDCEEDMAGEFITWGERDTGCQVDNADAEIITLRFPFHIESTAG
ncbi:hypothetical protein NVP1101O_011 [Vibrio phage 1.101.O._10N.261.45.C6]|nr:hypothetical protein NVP1101O_011 [Vibrio phage 1.101.O._10N.261.45.C6]